MLIVLQQKNYISDNFSEDVVSLVTDLIISLSNCNKMEGLGHSALCDRGIAVYSVSISQETTSLLQLKFN